MALSAPPAPLPLTNLPPPATRFVGRQHEIRTLTGLIADPEARLVTVVAPGGMGKTLFALEVARQNLHRFADGVYLVVLLAPSTGDQLATMIAETIGFQLQPGIPPEQQLVNGLRSRSMLLLLDNAEHLAQSAETVSSLLQHCPAVKILATSRVKLNLFAETLFPLGGLAYAADSVAADDAMELFLQRARSARFDFQFTPQSRPTVQAICELTQGMPLALVLAASWLALLSPEEILQEIRRSFDFLETDLHDMPERQRNLRSIFDYTWSLLDEADRRVLMRLSVFQDGFTREAAQTVAQGDLHRLMNLLKTGVLQPSLSGRRYELHELLRQYASEHLRRAGEHDAAQADHARYFLRFARQQEPDIKGGKQVEALDAMQEDIENIRLAWEWAVDHEQVDWLAEALDGVFWYGMKRARYQLLEELFETTRRLSPTSDPTRLLLAQVDLRRRWMRRWREGAAAPEAPGELETLLHIFQEANAARDSALCLVLLGDAQRTLTDDLERAEATIQSAYEGFTALGDDYYAAWALHFWARLTSAMHGIERSFDQLHRALDLRRQCDDRFGICYSLYNLSTDLLLLGRLQECEQVTREILEISRAIGEQSTLLMAQINLGLLALLGGRFEQAREQVTLNQRLASNLNHGLGLAWTHTIRSILNYFEGDTASARQQLPGSDGSAGQSFLRYFVHWAAALIWQEEETAAKDHLLSALGYASRAGAGGAMIWCVPAWAEWKSRYGEPKQAAALLGFVEQQPPGLLGWLPAWMERAVIQQRLEAQLGAAAFDAALMRGRAWTLETVVANLMEGVEPPAVSSTLPPHVLAANRQLVEPLSERELEVLAYIARGLSNREIADELVVELSTVKKHLTHIYGKLDVTTRAQAILRAQQLRLV